MEPTIKLPPPAPSDAFSLGDEDLLPSAVPPQSQQAQSGAIQNAVGVSTHPPAAHAESEQQKHTRDAGQKQQQQQPQHAGRDTPAASASSDVGHNSTQTPVHKQQHASSTAPAGPAGHAEDAPLPPTAHEQEPQHQAPQPDQSSSQDNTSLQDQRQERPQQPRHSRGLQPQDLSSVLSQLCDNAEAIAAAEEVLEGLLLRQATLHQLGRKMEQHQVLSVLQQSHLGFDKGRPVAAVLLYRCLLHWGLLHQTEQCPFLEQLAAVLQSQLDLEDASAPAEVAGLQCHVANSLTLCAVLYCVLLKAAHPQLAAAAAAEQRGPLRQLHSAAEVVAAARKKVSATWQQGVAHMGPGLQALGKLKIGGWGFKRSDDSAAAAAAGAGRSGSSSSSQAAHGSAEPHPEVLAQPAGSSSSSTATPSAAEHATAAHPAAEPGSPKAAPTLGAPAAESAAGGAGAEGGGGLHAAAPFDEFLLCLDQLVQHSYSLLRDQLKRRLTPLLADCISPENNVMAPAVGEDVGEEQPLSPSAAGAAVAGSAAESAAHAEAALMNYRSWSELVGVLHAALVALRSAHVPRALRATLMQQVLEFINCQLFNQLLLRPECCSVSNARYALRGLKQLDTWIVAEQSSSHHEGGGSRSSGRPSHAVTGAGSIHTGGTGSGSGSFNSQAPPEAPAASKPGGSSSSSAAAAAAGDDGSGGGGDAKQPAAVQEEDGGWEQVPADTGEFDSWQPHKQQQQQQQHWWRLPRQQQEQAGGPGEQPELGPEAWNALAHVRQALQFLVLDSKGALSLEDLTDHVCPALNHQQLYRLCTTAWTEAPDAADGGGGVSGEVLEQMKQLYTLSGNGGLIVTFLLDEPTGPLPFTQQQQQQPAAAAAAAAAGGSGSSAARCRLSSVVMWDDGRDYGVGLRPVPGVLVDEGCPAEVFEFVTKNQPWPPAGMGAPR